MLEAQVTRTAVGVVVDAAAGVVALAGLDSERGSLTVELIRLSSLNTRELAYFRGEGDGIPERFDDPELQKLHLLISKLCGSHAPVSVLLTAPTVLPDPDFDESVRPPLAVIEPNSPLLKVILAFAMSGLVTFISTVLNYDDPNSRIAVRQVPEAQLTEGTQSPLFLKHDLLMACTALLTDAPVSTSRAAAMAALIGAWPSSYSYWSSFGRMFSSMDIVTALRAGQSRTYLVCASETICARWNSRRNAEIVDEVALEHASAIQKHAYLPEEDALKVALISLGRAVGITVTCSSNRADAVKSKYTEVWPPREPLVWVVDMVREQP
jgi:hypothetical protein